MTRRVELFRRLDLRLRVLLVALAPMALVGLGLVFYFTFLRYGDVETALASRGGAMARQLAPAAEYGLFSGNVMELSRLAQAALGEPDVSGAAFFDSDGKLLVGVGALHSSLAPELQGKAWSGASADGMILIYHVQVSRNPVDYDDPFAMEQIDKPDPKGLGSLTLEVSRERVVSSKREILVVSLGAVFLMMIVAMLLATRLARDITTPLLRLEEAVARLRRGQLKTRVQLHGAGTVRGLEEGFNEMADALEAANVRLSAALASSEAELQAQYDFATALLQALSDAGVGILILHGERIVFANQAATAIHGLSHAELLIIPDWSELLPEAGRLGIRERVERAHQANWRGDRFESPVLLPDGSARHVEVVMTSLAGERSEPRVVMVEADVSERRDAEQRLSVANRELQAQRDDAQRANLAKSRFLAAASHDLRQPIQALTLFVGELDKQMQTPSQQRLSQQINAAVQLLVELFDTLLEISRIDIQDLRPKKYPLALAGWLEDLALSHAAAARDKGIELRICPSSVWVDTDPTLLARIVGNLLSNAVRYTERGRVLLGVRRDADSAQIQIWDSGVGIEEVHLPHLFQEFYQVGNPERDVAKGLGLGLSIVDRLAAVLAAPVTVRSWPGRGSMFSITLPLAPGPSRPASAARAPGPAVLLLLADAEAAKRLATTIAGWGYATACAAADEALAETLDRQATPVVVCEDSQWARLEAALPKAGRGIRLILLGRKAVPISHPAVLRIEQMGTPLRPARLRALLQHLVNEAAA